MARLHEDLYNEHGQSNLNFAPHLRELAETLLRSHKPAGCKLTLNGRKLIVQSARSKIVRRTQIL